MAISLLCECVLTSKVCQKVVCMNMSQQMKSVAESVKNHSEPG